MPWILSLMLGVSIGVGIYTFDYGKGLSYLSNDPKACVNCHVMQNQFDSWIKSSHHAAASCNDCHTPHQFPDKWLVKALNGWNHSKAFTLQNYPDPIRITPRNSRVLEHNCLYCHSEFVQDIAGHQNLQKDAVRCTECHRSVGHMNF